MGAGREDTPTRILYEHNAADADRIVEAVNGAAVAQQRIKLARDALVADGYFTELEVDDDVAPRIVELCAYLRSQWDAARDELERVRSGRPVFRGERRGW